MTKPSGKEFEEFLLATLKGLSPNEEFLEQLWTIPHGTVSGNLVWFKGASKKRPGSWVTKRFFSRLEELLEDVRLGKGNT